MNNKLIIGSHVSLKSPKYLLGSVEESISYNSNTFMVYTGAPQNTIRKATDTFFIKEAFELMHSNNIDPKNIIVHAPYIVNLGSSSESTRELAVSFLIKELKRVEELGFDKLVLHPGCILDQSYEVGLKYIVDGINYCLNEANNNVSILIETMAGKGTEIGRTIEQIKDIIINIKYKDKIGVCLDTCHLSDSGYNLEQFDEYINKFELEVGIDKIKCIHINDSKNIIGSHKDRHENIGYGNIGFENLLKVIYYDKFENIPKILETPYFNENAPYKKEIEMIKNKKFIN